MKILLSALATVILIACSKTFRQSEILGRTYLTAAKETDSSVLDSVFSAKRYPRKECWTHYYIFHNDTTSIYYGKLNMNCEIIKDKFWKTNFKAEWNDIDLEKYRWP